MIQGEKKCIKVTVENPRWWYKGSVGCDFEVERVPRWDKDEKVWYFQRKNYPGRGPIAVEDCGYRVVKMDKSKRKKQYKNVVGNIFIFQKEKYLLLRNAV